MSDFPTEQLEARLIEAGRKLDYPPTPDVARQISLHASRRFAYRRRRRWLATAAFLTLILLAGLLAVPPVRAAVLEFLQIGVIRIFPVAPTATPLPAHSGAPLPTSTLLPSLLDLAGEVPLEQVPVLTDLPVLAPTSPRDFGPPDYVFLQDMGGAVLILLWADPQQPAQVELGLFLFSPGTWGAEKLQPQLIAETQVNGLPAIWATGPYLLQLKSHDADIRRMVEEHVLIWEQNNITYRLESDWTMEGAVRAAESLRPVK